MNLLSLFHRKPKQDGNARYVTAAMQPPCERKPGSTKLSAEYTKRQVRWLIHCREMFESGKAGVR